MTLITREMKVKKNKINTILTATSESLGPVEAQLNTITSWAKAANRIIVHSNAKMAQFDGLRYMAEDAPETPLIQILRRYIVQIPGGEIFALAAPNVLISTNQSELFEFVDKNRMEVTWAGMATLPGEPGCPRAFIMSASILPHILRDMPAHLTFGNDEWALWMDAWLGKFILAHRYFDANQFNFVSKIPAKADYEPVAVVSEPLAIQTPTEPEVPVKAKGKPGRPKKQA